MNGLYIACGCSTVALAMTASVVLNKRLKKLSDHVFSVMNDRIAPLESRVDTKLRGIRNSINTSDKQAITELCQKTEAMINEFKSNKRLNQILEQNANYEMQWIKKLMK